MVGNKKQDSTESVFLFIGVKIWSSPLGTAVLAYTYIHTHTLTSFLPLPFSHQESGCTRNLDGTWTFHTLFTPFTVYVPRINHTDTLLLVWSFIFSSFCVWEVVGLPRCAGQTQRSSGARLWRHGRAAPAQCDYSPTKPLLFCVGNWVIFSVGRKETKC